MSYTSRSIQVLKGLEACRIRPGMYIGNTEDGSGLHHMVYEVLDNAIDEALAGYCDKILVTIDKEGFAIVEDNGRGIPVDMHEGEGISAAIVIMTQLHAGGKFDQNSYKVSGGLHGVGVSVVNALSDILELTIWRDGSEFQVTFKKGIPCSDLKQIGPSKKHGTRVRFFADNTIFSDIVFDSKILEKRIEELAYLNPTLNIILKDERNGYERILHQPDGIPAFVKDIAGNKVLLHDIVRFKAQEGNLMVEGAAVWSEAYSEETRCFTNTIPQKDGGTHLVGLRTGLTRCVQNYMQKESLFNKKNKDLQLAGEDIREGLICVLTVYMPDPQFASQTKEKLVSANIRPVVESCVTQAFEKWFEENPIEARRVIQRIVDAATARDAARKARDLSRKNKGAGEFSLSLASKLAGCAEKDPSKAELFIVEGDSAGGSAKMARNRLFQAVLPLKGKILNVEKASFTRMLNYDGIRTLIAVLGTGIGETFDITKIRYNKIILMTDADIDGSHILTLLLTFFFRYMRPVLENGYIYVAQPPLYGVKQGQKMHYLLNDRELADFLLDRSLDKVKLIKNSVEVDSVNEIKELLRDIFSMAADIERRGIMYQAFLGSKATDDLDKLLEHAKRIKPGNWKVEKREERIFDFTYEKNGLMQKYGFSYEKIPQNYTNLVEKWEGYWGDGVKLMYNGEEFDVHDPIDLYKAFNQKGTQGIHIQRYKGLGEMNAEDLAETAMQSYIQVRYEDEASSDALITKLMGDEVEPRRLFLEEIAPLLEADE